ncbi:MAG TPA: ATP-binding protein, partial [Kofleriaceae bacterium]|nr:ATP-binding protein [Kofleriaceae bacterium]
MGSPLELVHRAVSSALAPCVAAPGARIGVACSGGLDSLVLAEAARAVLGAAAVVVLHVDHGLGAGSSEVAKGVAAWAEARALAWEVRRVSVAPPGSRGWVWGFVPICA